MAVTAFRLLIIGAGPAGAAAAIFAARQGWKVTMADHRLDLWKFEGLPPKIGESLPPTVQPVLQELGLWSDFAGAAHLPSYGIQSYWGSERVIRRDYLTHPLGHGWHLDRRRFDNLLLSRAQATGAVIVPGAKLRNLTLANNEWTVMWSTEHSRETTRTFDFIIDASGRNSIMARRSGLDRLYEHQHLALVRFLTTTSDFADSTGLVETTADGWWYTAKLPNNRISSYFFCRPNKVQKTDWITATGWNALVTAAPATAARLAATKEALTEPRFFTADSSILELPYGSGWLAVGDAALTLDPVSSHGITLALVTARDGIRALERYTAAGSKALVAYHQILTATFYRYTQQRRQLYRSERRFEKTHYWNG